MNVAQNLNRLTILCFACFFMIACEQEAFVKDNPPVLVSGTEFLDFGELPLGYTATRSLQMVNAGGQELFIDDYIALSDENVFMATFEQETIAAGSSVNVFIAFTPSEEQRYEGVLRIKSNTANGEEVQVNLRGTGLSDVVCGDCETPPGDICEDEMTVLTYRRDGECAEDVCRYVKERIDCPNGCEDGLCLEAPSNDAGPDDLLSDDGGLTHQDDDAGIPSEPTDAGMEEVAPPTILFYGFSQNFRSWENANIDGMCWLADAPVFEIQSENYQLNGIIELR